MLRFRPPSPNSFKCDATNLLAVGEMIDALMQPGNFIVDPQLQFTWIAARSETIPWEIYRGRLLPPSQTRQERTFLSWHVVQVRPSRIAPEPMISVKLDVHHQQIYVTRGIINYVWEGFESSGGVIDSREVIAWTHELVGAARLEEFEDLEPLRDEVMCLIWQAVVGTSRLPLTSLEAPLPGYLFGELHYVYCPGAGASPEAAKASTLPVGLRNNRSIREDAKLLEFALRKVQVGELPKVAQHLCASFAWEGIDASLFPELFNNVSLSPHTSFAEHALELLQLITACVGDGFQVDYLSRLLRQLSRHLTAYDLVTFHHRGANYPDALLLNSTLLHYLACIAKKPELFVVDDPSAKRRRRALRNACLLRRHYEGHFVPDAPTSPGENARVLPASHPRVPEEQLTQTTRRRKQLFADAPLKNLLTSEALEVLAQSVRDLEHLEERVEMGLGLFIDRPLGYHKQIGEPDLTPLLAHEAFSPSIARRRWAELKKLSRELDLAIDENRLDALFARNDWPAGLPNSELADCPLPTAALADVRKVASDFVILRTMPRGLKILLDLFDWRPLLERHRLAFLADQHVRLCVQVPGNDQTFVLALYDSELQKRIELQPDTSGGYQRRAGVEWPRRGLRVLRVREDGNDSWKACDISIRAR